MTLDDLKNNPTLVTENLQISGPGGGQGGGNITVSTRIVMGKVSDDTHDEPINRIQNAVESAHAKVGQLPGRIEVSRDGLANCYWLPWASGKVYTGQLGNAHEYFFTYKINGCGFIIGGTAAQPLVAHANLESDRLTQVALDAMGKGPSAGVTVAKEQALIYEQFYANLAARLIQLDEMSGARLEVVTPQQYLIDAGAGFGAVFGINNGGAWEFFGNWAKQTKRIWP